MLSIRLKMIFNKRRGTLRRQYLSSAANKRNKEFKEKALSKKRIKRVLQYKRNKNVQRILWGEQGVGALENKRREGYGRGKSG